MKHLIETTNPSGLAITEYDRIILDSATNEIVYRGGVNTEFVDLGLPSGLKWAKCNVGAKKETDYGDYFMWGSTKANTPDECTWEHTPFNGGNTSYNADAINSAKDTVCPNGILAKEYDAAAHIMGGDWRMPTKGEIKELIDNTTTMWVENFNDSGVNGRKLTSKTDTSKYIFIPAAGRRLDSTSDHQGSNGHVWSSSFNNSYPDRAYILNVKSGNLNSSSNYYFSRYNGLSVRGVCS